MKYLVLMLLLIGCTQAPSTIDPSIVYGTKVQLKGFYRNCDAIIDDVNPHDPHYYIRISCRGKGLYFYEWHHADEFEIIKDQQK